MTFLVLLVACARSDAHARKGEAAATRTASHVRYELTSYDGGQLPQPFDLEPSRCARQMRAAWLQITKSEWESVDSLRSACDQSGATTVVVERGQIKHAGDTIVFTQTDMVSHRARTLDRGVASGDSLRTGGELFDGAPRLYRRR